MIKSKKSPGDGQAGWQEMADGQTNHTVHARVHAKRTKSADSLRDGTTMQKKGTPTHNKMKQKRTRVSTPTVSKRLKTIYSCETGVGEKCLRDSRRFRQYCLDQGMPFLSWKERQGTLCARSSILRLVPEKGREVARENGPHPTPRLTIQTRLCFRSLFSAHVISCSSPS